MDNVGLSRAQLWIMLDYQGLNCVHCWIIKGSLPIRAQHDTQGHRMVSILKDLHRSVCLQ